MAQSKTRTRVRKRLNYKLLIVVALVIVIGSYGAYASVTSAELSEEYVISLRADAVKLKPQFKTLEATAAAKSFDSPDAPILQYQADLVAAQKQIDSLRTSLDKFERDYKDPAAAPFTRYLPFYDGANNSSKDVRYMAIQTRIILDKYESLVKNLQIMNQLEISLESTLNEVNGVTDFNTLLFKGSVYRTRAANILAQTDALKKIALPAEYQQYKDSLTTRASALSTGLQSLARGLDSASDSVIYGSAIQIENLTNGYFTVDKQLRFDANQKSLTLKQVGEITEKLDAFDPSETSD